MTATTLIFTLLSLSPSPIFSVQSSPHPYRLTLPDSTQSPPIHLIGSPGVSLTVDDRGYTVLVDSKDGYVKYATRNQDGEVIPSEFKMLADESLDPGEVYNLTKYVEPSREVKDRECGRYCVEERARYEWRGDSDGCDMFCLEGGIFNRSESERRFLWEKARPDVYEENHQDDTSKTIPRELLTKNNKLINLVIPIRFANHASRPTIDKFKLSTLFNSPQPVEGITPTGSIREYFAINSYGKLIVESTVVDWISVKNTEQYYAGKKSGLDDTFHESLVEALRKLDKDPNFNFKDYDRDGDGVVDSVFFLHSGYSAEWGDVDCINGNDRSNRIWSHKWNIGGNGNHGDMGWMSKDGVRVNDYAVSSALYGACRREIARIGTIAHEMGRLFGLPSLYGGDAPHGGNGIGSFGLMGNSWGQDGEQYKPPLLSPWSKMELGWLEPVTIHSSGRYSLPPFASNPKVFRINLGREDEFLLLENRLTGLVMWHIDNRAQHYPSENLMNSDSLGCHAHYRVSLISSEGTFELEQGVNRGVMDDIFGSNHTIGPGFTGEETSYPNTDSYREGVVTPSGIQITSISDVQDDLGGVIEFTVLFPGEIISYTVPPTPEPTMTVSNSPSIRKSLLSTYGSNTGSTGIMFDLVALESVEIISLDLHLRSGADEGEKMIEVYAMSGTHIGNENSTELWSKICCSKKVIGNGVSKRTVLDSSYFFQKLPVSSGEKIALYVASDEPIVRYCSTSKECCEVYASSLDLQILEGSGVGSHPFGPTVKSRVFNGAIHYDTKQNGHSNNSPGEPPSRSSTGVVKSATSTYFSGNSGAHGIMFDVIPKKEMIATGLSFHTNSVEDLQVNVWVREGTYVGYERDQLSWKHVCDHALVKGQGSLRPTSITHGFQEFNLHTYERIAIYITLSTPNLRYTKPNDDKVSAGDIVYDLPDISIFAGSGVKGFPFGTPISPRLWNGIIQYELLDDEYNETKSSVKASSNISFVGDTNTLSTSFASGNRGYGCMFDISNTEGNYAGITSIDFHTNLISDINIIVYSKIGSFIGSEFKPSDWIIIVNTTVTGQGYYKRTPIPMGDFTQISIPNGAIQGFYLTLDKPNLLYSNVEENLALGDVMYKSKGVRFHIGNGLQGTFSSVYQPRLFNGAIHFYQKSDEPYESEPASMEPTNYQFETALNGDLASFGVMFSIRNKHSNPIYIAAFLFHTEIETDCAVELYAMPGTYLGREQSPSEWTKLLGTQSKCAGTNKWSVLPTSSLQPVEILAGKQHSFYITLEKPSLKLNTNMDSEARGDKYIEILNGSSVAGYPFGLNLSPRQPVISIGYEVEPDF